VALQNPHRVDLGNAVASHRGDMSAKTLEERLGWGSGKVSRIEAGKWTLKDSEVLDLARVLELPAEATESLRALAALARKRRPHPFIADYATSYVSFEQASASIDAYSDELVPGIGQCAVYATAVLAYAGVDDVAERVAARLDRQKILTAENPPRVRLLLGEAVLHRLVGGTAGLRQQLEHMIAQVDMESIELGVDRFASGAHQCMGSRFNIVRRPNGDARVYIESALTSTYLHEPQDVDAHQGLFDRLWDRAAKGGASATILRKRIQQLA
jgi:hypothetical protein